MTENRPKQKLRLKRTMVIIGVIIVTVAAISIRVGVQSAKPDAITSATVAVGNRGQYLNEGDGNVLIILFSGGNTRKLANAIASETDAAIYEPGESLIVPKDIEKYDLIGFGSGIFSGKHHSLLLEFAEKLPDFDGKQAFIFSTNGAPSAFAADDTRADEYRDSNHRAMRELLEEKRLTVSGEFSCPGLNKNSFLKLFGGLNKTVRTAMTLKTRRLSPANYYQIQGRITMTENKKTARIAGATYLTTSLILMFSYFIAGENMLVSGDTVAILGNINANIGLFWAGTAAFFIGYAGFVLTAAVLYRLFKQVNANMGKLIVILMTIGVIIVLAGKIAGVAAVYTDSIDGSARLLALQLQTEMAAELFWGVWLVPIALLIFKSNLFPKILGIFLLGACVQHVSVCVEYFLGLDFPEAIVNVLLVISMLGEFGFVGYSLVKGVKTIK